MSQKVSVRIWTIRAYLLLVQCTQKHIYKRYLKVSIGQIYASEFVHWTTEDDCTSDCLNYTYLPNSHSDMQPAISSSFLPLFRIFPNSIPQLTQKLRMTNKLPKFKVHIRLLNSYHVFTCWLIKPAAFKIYNEKFLLIFLKLAIWSRWSKAGNHCQSYLQQHAIFFSPKTFRLDGTV